MVHYVRMKNTAVCHSRRLVRELCSNKCFLLFLLSRQGCRVVQFYFFGVAFISIK
jgi:hypothetical protein